MDKEKMINDIRKVLLDYCITDLRSNEAARNGHKDDYTVLDYGKYVGAKTLAITVLEHIPEYCRDDKKKMKEFFFGVHEEAMSKASQRIMTAEDERRLAMLALQMTGPLKEELCTQYDEDNPVWGHCWTNRSSADGPKHVHVCPAWDDKTMSCMLDKREILFRKKR